MENGQGRSSYHYALKTGMEVFEIEKLKSWKLKLRTRMLLLTSNRMTGFVLQIHF